MCMATLQRRVQVLFDPDQYAALEAAATAERMSVGALVREAVSDRLRRRVVDKRAAWTALMARAEADPVPVPANWDDFKDEIDRDILREL